MKIHGRQRRAQSASRGSPPACHSAALELTHDVEHAAHELRIERGGRLVEQHHLGFECERPRDRNPLLLSTGQLGRMERAFSASPTRSSAASAMLRASCAFAQDLGERQSDVSERGHVGIEVGRLQRPCRAPPHGVHVLERAMMSTPPTRILNRPSVPTGGCNNAATGLARPRGTDDEDQLLWQYGRGSTARLPRRSEAFATGAQGMSPRIAAGDPAGCPIQRPAPATRRARSGAHRPEPASLPYAEGV